MSKSTHWAKEDILRLSLLRAVPYRLQNKIIESFPSLDAFLQNPPDWFNAKINDIFNKYADCKDFDIILEKLHKNNIAFTTIFEDDYPQNLKHIEYAPIVLYYKGIINNDRKCIAIVGTRKNTLYGKIATEKIVAELVANGIAVVSGLAYGIDSIAHRETLKNKGITYAVVASGIDEISPQISKELAAKIINSGGAVISEYPPGMKAKPQYFPQRNRIISGISIALIVIESDTKGGSMITARFAADQNREIFALPGQISSSKSAGCNRLIHDNIATAILSPESPLVDLGIVDKIDFSQKNQEIKFDDDLQKMIFEEISSEPLHIDVLADKLNTDVATLLVKLLELEFKGLARQLPGKYFIKK